MLLILFVVHALAKKAEAGPWHDALSFRNTSDTCDDINNCRRLFDIVWGCLTTIFACTWISVHPNVPPPNTSWLGLLLRRLKLMLVAVIAPEVMVNFAARQFLAARMFSEEFDVSKTHGFFLCMGGFVTESQTIGNVAYPIVTKEQLMHAEYLPAIWKVTVAQIKDKSKGDALSKGVALAQGIWFVVQCMARFAQHLPVTELEVATLAFAVVNVFVWSLWWDKPLDVQEPISVGPMEEVLGELRATPHLDFKTQFMGMFTGDYEAHDPFSSSAVPSFWSASNSDTPKSMGNYPFLAELLVGAIFGAIHCVAWNADFASLAEKWMWRSSALLVAVFPLLLLSSLLVLSAFVTLEEPLFLSMLFLAIPPYIIARLLLLVLPFAALHTLPASTFVDVNWSVYIPHL